MAKKPSIATLVGGFASASRLNTIFQQILDSFDNTLSRDGSTPNTMEADLDLNNNDLLNAKEVRATKLYAGGVQVTDATYVPNWRGEWATATAYVVNDTVRNDGNVYICLVAHTSGTFSTDLGAAKWQLFASKGSAGAGTGDLLAANNLSDLADASAARTNLGLSIGNDVLAYTAKSAALAAATWAANKLFLLSGTDTVGTVDFVDEDDMSSDSAAAIPSQQSVKAYTDSHGIVQRVHTSTATHTTFTTASPALPIDDTIPQITEGTQVISLAVTPTASGNRLRINPTIMLGHSVNGGEISWALFRSGQTNAIRAGAFSVPSNNSPSPLSFEVEIQAATTSAVTFSLRVDTASGTGAVNGTSSGRVFGGSATTEMTITEIKA